MATDFKIKKEYIQDHTIKIAGVDRDGNPTFSKQSSDPMRDYFEILYGSVNSAPQFTQEVRLERYMNGYRAKPTVPANNGPALVEKLESLKEEVDGKIYADFNFKIDENFQKNFSISSRTIRRGLNSFDIRSTDDFFTGGELPQLNDKDETSFKFAYAFITTETKEGVDLIVRDVKVATPNPKELQEDANNKNNTTNVLSRLKHILYDGDTSSAVEKTVIGTGGEDNFKIDKVYNIITVVVPKENPQPNKGFDYYTSFKNIRKAVFDNQFGPPLQPDKLSDLYKELSINYFARAASGVDDGFTFASITQGDLAGSNVYSIPDQFIKQSTPDSQATGFGGKYNSILNLISVSKDSVYVKQQNNITTSYGSNSPFTIVKDGNFLNSNLSQAELREINSYYAGYDYVMAPFMPSQTPYFTSPQPPLNDWTISEIFRSSITNGSGIRWFSSGEINKNLIRKAKLVGISVVKSRRAFDTENPLKPNEIIQTFHINIQQSTEDKKITIFDSQVAYGEEYFYTALGVFAVDGKYYFYDKTEISTGLSQIGQTGSTVTETTEVIKNNVDLNATKNAIDKLKLIGIDESNDNNSAVVFTNPCCQYKDEKFKDVGGGFDPDALGWGVPTPGWNFDGYGEELHLKVESLVGASKAGTVLIGENPRFTELKKAVKQINNSPYGDAIKCWICRRRPEGESGKSILAFLEDQFNGEEFNYLLNSLQCQTWGWSSKEGNIKGSKIEAQSFIHESNNDSPEPVIAKTNLSDVKRCKIRVIEIEKKDENNPVFEKRLLDFTFDIREANARAVYQIPISSSIDATPLEAIPFAPIPTFISLAGVDNKIKISFQEAVANQLEPVKQDAAFLTFNGSQVPKIIKVSKKLSKEFGIPLPEDPTTLVSSVFARSEADISQIHVRKLGRRPESLQDLIDNGEQQIINFKKQTSYYSKIRPNQKYYYAFVSRDIAGLFSNSTPVFEVEIVNDSGFVYTKITNYEFPEKEKGITNKTFKKILKIKPSFEELQPTGQPALLNFIETIGTQDKFPDKVSIYSNKTADNETGTKPPKFKIRVRSKKTNRVFDINLKYTQETRLVTSIEGEQQVKEFSELIDQKDIAGTDD